MRTVTILLILACVGAIAAPAQAPDLSRLDVVERSVPDGPVALVQGSPISREEFLFLYRTQLAMATAQQRGEEVSTNERVRTGLRCLGELMQREILYQEAKKRALTVPESAIDEAFAEKLERLRTHMEQRADQKLSKEDVLERTGQTEEEARESLRKSLLVQKAWDAISEERGVSVPEADIERFYNERPELFRRPSRLHLRQIFVSPTPSPQKADEDAWNAARKRVEKALARIKAGEKFTAVAESVSDAPNKARGGDLGMVPAMELPEFYREAAAKLEPGEVSDVIRSEYGLHVVQLVDSEPGADVPLEEARDRIEELLTEAKKEEAIALYCEPIVNDPDKVKIFLHLEDALTGSATEAS